jgi:hypothetical protein
LGLARFLAMLWGMSADPPPEGAVISPHRLAEIIEDIDGFDPVDLEALLAALTTAAWPSRHTLEH